jgi:hypothetical protein
MKKLIEENIELLKEKLEMNKQVIDKNREALRGVIKQPHSKERTELFFHHFKVSLELFSRNCHFIKMQAELSKSITSSDASLKSFGRMSLS